MTNDEEFCLRWNNYEQGITSTVQKLRQDQDFLDVSIFCSGSLVRAHKAILSSCSPVFRRILKENTYITTSCTIVLWDAEPRDLSAILDFVYLGEVTVHQENIEGFLSLAGKLEIEGLCEKSTDYVRRQEKQKEEVDSNSVKIDHRNNASEVSDDDELVEVKAETEWSSNNHAVDNFSTDPETTGGGGDGYGYGLVGTGGDLIGGPSLRGKELAGFTQQVMQFLKGNKGKLWNFFTVVTGNPRYAQCNVSSCHKRISRGSDDPCKMTSAPLKKHLITCHTALIADELGLSFI